MVDNTNDMRIAGTNVLPGKPRTVRERRAAGKLLAMLRAGIDVRSRKTRRLRGAVRAGRYENDLKFAIAIDKLLADL
jgi:hypothetical protein